MTTIDQIRTSFRRVDRSRYPELVGYTVDEIYGNGDRMAPGALFLASAMSRSLGVGPGSVVLDLGCGRGDSSIFLARHLGVRVVSVDLWISEDERIQKSRRHGLQHLITPLRLDARKPLPFADDYFDAVFCMQALHSLGGSNRFLQHLLKHLRKDGRMVVGTTCFSEAVSRDTLPDIYRQTDGWDAEYEKYHWPEWWKSLFEESGLVDVLECRELDDGAVYWEDDVIYGAEKAQWSGSYLNAARWLIDHIAYGRSNRPYLTHFLATLQKR